MKMLILLLLLVFWSLRIQAETVNTIGTGTSTQKQPFGMYYGYERCATLYTTTTGYITSLGWYVGTGNPVTCPIRIYIKQTTSSTLSSSTWAVMKNGATLVYNGTLSFQTVGWQTIDIADYTHTGTKIIVLCESNYGGIGASTYPVFRYSNSTGAQEWWQGDDSTSVNTTLGTISANRPNIQITYNSISNPAPPSGFLATAVNSEQINLNWIKNSANDSVMVAYNSTNAFGTPSGMLHVGNTITGGGTIIYKGLGLSFSHSSGLSPSNTYYYRAWSVHASPPLYSAETSAAATTPCSITTYFPHLSDFDSAVFPPLCWSVAGLHWAFSSSASGYGIGGGAVVADFFNVASGNFDLISPEVDFTSLTDPVVTFDYAYATSNSLIDMLEIWYSTSYEHNYTLLTSMAGGAAGPLNTGGSTNLEFIPAAHQWATESYNLPSGTTRVLFRGISSNGNNLFLDNITFHGNCPAPEELAATNFTSSGAELGWTPVGVSGTWQIRWGVVGFDTLNEGALIPGVTSNLYFLEGLQPGQVYEFYVRSDCGGAYSSWAGPVSFSAVCESVNVPFYENFDLLTIPSTGCQEVINSNGDNITWITSSDFPASYSNSMFISKNSALEMNDWFFSPGVSLVEGITYSFNFVYRGNGAGSPGKLELLVGSGPTPSEMTGGLLWSDSDIQTSEYFPGTFNYIPVASGITFFGFHGYSTAGTGFLCVDDIAIDEAFIYWNGNNSSAWGDPANWFPQVIPNGFQNVIISSGTPNNPAIDYQGPECKNLTIEPGAMLSIIPGGEITVKGNITIREAAILNNEGLIILKGDLNNQNPE